MDTCRKEGRRAATSLAGNEHSASSPQSSNAEIARKRRARSPALVPGAARLGWLTPARIIILPVFATNEYPMTYNFTCGQFPASKNTTYSLSDISKNGGTAAGICGFRRLPRDASRARWDGSRRAHGCPVGEGKVLPGAKHPSSAPGN